MAATETTSNTNFRAPLETINAALATYLAGVSKITGQASESQVKTGNSALGALKAVVDALVADGLVTRAAAEAEIVAFEIASGAVGADAKFIGSTVQSLDDRMALLAGARKMVEDSMKAFLTHLDNESAKAAKAKDTLAPKKDEKK